jgi:hypothetical protein
MHVFQCNLFRQIQYNVLRFSVSNLWTIVSMHPQNTRTNTHSTTRFPASASPLGPGVQKVGAEKGGSAFWSMKIPPPLTSYSGLGRGERRLRELEGELARRPVGALHALGRRGIGRTGERPSQSDYMCIAAHIRRFSNVWTTGRDLPSDVDCRRKVQNPPPFLQSRCVCGLTISEERQAPSRRRREQAWAD